MKNILIVLTLAAVVFSGCELVIDGIKGNGKVIKKEVKIKDFTTIDVSSGFDVYLSEGDKTHLRIEADENLMPHIRTYVDKGTLKISSRKNIWKSKSLKVYVTYTQLNGISASGGSDIYANNEIKTQQFNLQMSGGSDADLKLKANRLHAEMSGGADLEMHFTGADFSLSGSGGSDSELTLLQVKNATFQLSGGSDASVIGECDVLTLNNSGGSDFNGRGFKAKRASVNASGAADAKLHVTEEISVSASGASSVSCDGGAKVVNQDIGKSASFRLN